MTIASVPHISVLPEEVLEGLAVKKNGIYLDLTAGAGGHMQLVLNELGENGRLIAIDRDQRAFADDAAGGVVAASGGRAQLYRRQLSEAQELLKELNIDGVDGVLADLGVSSMQLNERQRGFSFRGDAPLDMRMDTSKGMSAYDYLLEVSEEDLANCIYLYGEDRFSRQIAKAIKTGVIPSTTKELADRVCSVVFKGRSKIHPATKTFQALRIQVNEELLELEKLLDFLPDILNVGGRACIIAFHSLEDRPVKLRFRELGRNRRHEEKDFALICKKPIVASENEMRLNPRSRSAKLRILEKIK